MTEQTLTKAGILIDQRKYKEADKILTDLMSINAENDHLLYLYSFVSLQLNDTKKALDLINNAIKINPDNDSFYYQKARIYVNLEKYEEAEKYLEEAIRIEPHEASYFALSAAIKLDQREYTKALELTDRALECDPSNVEALNYRSTILMKLNRKDESVETIGDALQEDPENPFTHSTVGWNMLEKGDHKKALEHFREALRLDPNFEYAQAGMMEALKAKLFFYRWFLNYGFWLGNKAAKYQWGFIIGFYLIFRFTKNIAIDNEGLRPVLVPLLIILGLFAFSTWIINPLTNLLFRLNKYGNFLLDKDEKKNSALVGLCGLIFLGGMVGLAVTGEMKWLVLGIFGLAMMVPFSSLFSSGKKKNIFFLYGIGMLIVGLLSLAITFSNGVLVNGLSIVFIVGFIGFQVFANFVNIHH